MILSELLQRKVPYKVVKASATGFVTRATVKGRDLKFYATTGGGSDVWDIVFGEIDGRELTVSKTGNGGELEVLAFVKDSLIEFAERYQPSAVHFTASTADRSRSSVYERILKRALPGWAVKMKDDGQGDMHFTATK